MNNTEKTKVYYRKAVKLANSIYELFDEVFAELPIVVYSVSINRWYNHASVDVWATIGNVKVDDELKELVGNVCRSFSFSRGAKTRRLPTSSMKSKRVSSHSSAGQKACKKSSTKTKSNKPVNGAARPPLLSTLKHLLQWHKHLERKSLAATSIAASFAKVSRKKTVK